MEELERQKEKYDALEKTWMAANQQFMEFQVCSWLLKKKNPKQGPLGPVQNWSQTFEVLFDQ